MNIFDKFEKTTEIIGWILIFFSIFLLSAVISALVYFPFQNLWTSLLGCLILAIGVFSGIKLANKKFKEEGTIQFLSRVSASPELDEKNDVKNKN